MTINFLSTDCALRCKFDLLFEISEDQKRSSLKKIKIGKCLDSLKVFGL